jgi:hypothetical protein
VYSGCVYVRSSFAFFRSLFSDIFTVYLFQFLSVEFCHIEFCDLRRMLVELVVTVLKMLS